jgi:hypothetical protein
VLVESIKRQLLIVRIKFRPFLMLIVTVIGSNQLNKIKKNFTRRFPLIKGSRQPAIRRFVFRLRGGNIFRGCYVASHRMAFHQANSFQFKYIVGTMLLDLITNGLSLLFSSDCGVSLLLESVTTTCRSKTN